jgi:hypothetical protein
VGAREFVAEALEFKAEIEVEADADTEVEAAGRPCAKADWLLPQAKTNALHAQNPRETVIREFNMGLLLDFEKGSPNRWVQRPTNTHARCGFVRAWDARCGAGC